MSSPHNVAPEGCVQATKKPKERSKRPRKKVCSYSGLTQHVSLNSWFTHTKQTIQHRTTKKEDKIRVFPTRKQKETLKSWFNACKWTYNKAVELMENGCEKLMNALHPLCVQKHLFKGNPDLELLLKTPFNIRDAAMIDHKSNFALAKKDGRKFEIGFKTTCRSIDIRKESWTGSGIFYPRMFGRTPLKGRTTLPAEKVNRDARLIVTNAEQYFLTFRKAWMTSLKAKLLSSRNSLTCECERGLRHRTIYI